MSDDPVTMTPFELLLDAEIAAVLQRRCYLCGQYHLVRCTWQGPPKPMRGLTLFAAPRPVMMRVMGRHVCSAHPIDSDYWCRVCLDCDFLNERYAPTPPRVSITDLSVS